MIGPAATACCRLGGGGSCPGRKRRLVFSVLGVFLGKFVPPVRSRQPNCVSSVSKGKKEKQKHTSKSNMHLEIRSEIWIIEYFMLRGRVK